MAKGSRIWGVVEIITGSICLVPVIWMVIAFAAAGNAASGFAKFIVIGWVLYLFLPFSALIISGSALLSNKRALIYLSWLVRVFIVLFYLTNGFAFLRQNIEKQNAKQGFSNMPKEDQLFAAVYNERPGADINRNRDPQKTAAIIDALLLEGVDINAKKEFNGEKYPILTYAIITLSDQEVIRFLLAKGADVNARNRAGETPLVAAIAERNKELVGLLLNAGADVNSKAANDNSATVLISALSGRLFDMEILKMLVEKGAEINVKDQKGRTPLMWAAYYKRVDAIKYLIERGADINARDNSGKKAIDYSEILGIIVEDKVKEEITSLLSKSEPAASKEALLTPRAID